MRKILLSFFSLMLIGLVDLSAQDLSKPKSGNAIRLKEYSVTIAQGETLNADIWVVKAKKYKLNLGTPDASGKAGISFDFESKQADPIQFGMQIKVDASMPAGDYMYILNVPGNGRSAVKSTTIMVKVVEASPQ